VNPDQLRRFNAMLTLLQGASSPQEVGGARLQITRFVNKLLKDAKLPTVGGQPQEEA